MNPRVVAFVACRLLALIVAFNFVSAAVVNLVISLVYAGGSADWRAIAIRTIALVIYGALAAASWILAGPISKRFVISVPTDLPATLGVEDAKSLAVAFTGGLFLYGAVGAINSAASVFLRHQSQPGDGLYRSVLLTAAVYLLVGGLLIIQAGRIVRGIDAVRAWGNKPFIARDSAGEGE